jgi:hypothetical protein
LPKNIQESSLVWQLHLQAEFFYRSLVEVLCFLTMDQHTGTLPRSFRSDWDKFTNTTELRALVWSARSILSQDGDVDEEKVSSLDADLRSELVNGKWKVPTTEATVAITQSFEAMERMSKKRKFEHAISKANLEGRLSQLQSTNVPTAGSGSGGSAQGSGNATLTAPDQKILNLSTRLHIPKNVVEAISKGVFTFAHASRPSHALVARTEALTVIDGSSKLNITRRSVGKQCVNFQEWAQCMGPVLAVRRAYNISTAGSDQNHMVLMRDFGFVNMSSLGANALDSLIRSVSAAHKVPWDPVHQEALTRLAIMSLSSKWIKPSPECRRCGYLGHVPSSCPLQTAVEVIKEPPSVQVAHQQAGGGKGNGRGGKGGGKNQHREICFFFATAGKKCTRGKKCRHVHFCTTCSKPDKHASGCASA